METKCKVDCPCGWTDVFSSAYSGLQLDCPRCGKRHRIPMFGQPQADDEIDMDVMSKLLKQDSSASTSVNFKPLLLGTLAFAAVASVIGTVLVFALAAPERTLVFTATVVGGSFAWPLAISVAWLGQKRQLKRGGGQ